ncbi:hypothetical protein K435DRAFT_851104 [Dendrothele bispora CBS 962.96]|uniref:Uncharacterized protein n=1 Tax=Dendrothele bispora (strain CBS 962.96) TaxID=1314807 RepID=A0A4S8MMW7_DENBC|nr:hypothetical protein K435DRAFT_856514 [Dendrothele bispora CBS 962.96]THV04280.1 hypothetical protein K435DRAFT_851104 [Dendrothele bispora CBS 962.96]
MSNNAHRCPDHTTAVSCMETGAVIGLPRTSTVARLPSPAQSSPTNASSDLERISRNEGPPSSLREVLDGYRERCNAQDRQLTLLRQQLDGVAVVQDRLGQRLIELASFALLAYRGNPIQIFSNLHEMIDGMFTWVYGATIRVHGEEKDAALESLESLLTRMETFQSFLCCTEATSRRFIGDNRDRGQNERFLLSNIPPQATLPHFHVTLERTRLPYPESRKSPSRPPFTPPNTPAGSDARGIKRPREELTDDGEIVAKRRC